MAIAAVPAYLGKDFSQASPGLRFGMYLPLWGVDSRNGELLWTTHDVNQRATGPRQELRLFQDQNKNAAFRSALSLSSADSAAMTALRSRQSALAQPLAEQGRLLTLQASAVAPFSTGLGNEHPLENGFAFLNPYGLPYLAGSGVKGVLRQAARELAGTDWNDGQSIEPGWTEQHIDALFGRSSKDGETELQRGALSFWDVIPLLEGNAMQVEIMTPHQSHYYQNGAAPHESGQPNPIHFLSVPPGSKFTFHVQCNLPLLSHLAADLARDGSWLQLVNAAFVHAFQWLGFGAKTAVGYGAMQEDPAARLQREQRAEAQRQALADAAREQARAAMTAEQREAMDANVWMSEFSAMLEQERNRKTYKPGSLFDDRRNAVLKLALALNAPPVRHEAAKLLRASYKFTEWPSKKERKNEVKAMLTQLDGQP